MPDKTNPADETFTTRDIAEGVAHDLVLQAEEAVQSARGLAVTDPARHALMSAAASALAGAAPFVGKRGARGTRTRTRTRAQAAG